LKFCIDGVEKDTWSGEEDWAEVSFPVTAGTRTFEWTYSKDGSDSSGDDTAWIDDIVFPVDSGPEPSPPPPTPPDVQVAVEDFETNDFKKLPWEHEGDSYWTTTSWGKHSGNYSAQAGSIDHDESTTLKVTLNCAAGEITFYHKVSSESTYDYLKFYIDGVEKDTWSGEEDWAEVSFPVTAGTRTFEWTYSKDGSDSSGDDTAWIDDIVFPVQVQEPPTPPPPTPTPNLVGWWKFDEGSGTTAFDSSGNENYGSLRGGPQWVAGKIGGALEFDGRDDYVDTGYAADLPVWTICTWVISPDAPSGAMPSGPVHREKNYQINWNHDDTTFRGAAGLHVGGIWYAASFGQLEANTWYQLAATYNRQVLKSYKNGVIITSSSAPSGNPSPEGGTLKFARHSIWPQYFGGTIDDVRIYNKALTLEEIRQAMRGD
jgi:hypothetical protein